MLKVSRDWATPLTIGSFMLMAVTGVLMFFHLDRGLNKVAHEWLGWLMVAAVAAHALVNLPAVKRHLLLSRLGRGVVAACLLLLAASFATLPGGKAGELSPPVLAMQAVARAPLNQVAPLSGKPVDQLMRELANAGLAPASADQSLASALGNDRQKTAAAMRLLFAR